MRRKRYEITVESEYMNNYKTYLMKRIMELFGKQKRREIYLRSKKNKAKM